METLRSISELSRLPGPLFLAIGVFDGVHLGHQAVISTSAEHAKVANGTPVVVTFDPHVLARIEGGQSGGVIVARIDRFARTLIGGLQAVESIEQVDGVVLTADGEFDTSTAA